MSFSAWALSWTRQRLLNNSAVPGSLLRSANLRSLHWSRKAKVPRSELAAGLSRCLENEEQASYSKAMVNTVPIRRLDRYRRDVARRFGNGQHEGKDLGLYPVYTSPAAIDCGAGRPLCWSKTCSHASATNPTFLNCDIQCAAGRERTSVLCLRSSTTSTRRRYIAGRGIAIPATTPQTINACHSHRQMS